MIAQIHLVIVRSVDEPGCDLAADDVEVFGEVDFAAGQVADVNAKRPGGQVPLHRAAMLADERIVQLLLESGADTGATDYFGTAADWARRFNRGRIAELIDSRHEGR